METDIDAHFVIRKSYFTVSDEVANDEQALAYAIASQTPAGAKLSSVREPGGYRYTWRVISVVMTPRY